MMSDTHAKLVPIASGNMAAPRLIIIRLDRLRSCLSAGAVRPPLPIGSGSRRRPRAEALALRSAPRRAARTQQPPPLARPMASLDMASPKTAEAGRKNGSSPKGADYPKNYVKSQEHLLSASTRNPEPTMMPPPVAGLARRASLRSFCRS